MTEQTYTCPCCKEGIIHPTESSICRVCDFEPENSNYDDHLDHYQAKWKLRCTQELHHRIVEKNKTLLLLRKQLEQSLALEVLWPDLSWAEASVTSFWQGNIHNPDEHTFTVRHGNQERVFNIEEVPLPLWQSEFFSYSVALTNAGKKWKRVIHQRKCKEAIDTVPCPKCVETPSSTCTTCYGQGTLLQGIDGLTFPVRHAFERRSR